MFHGQRAGGVAAPRLGIPAIVSARQVRVGGRWGVDGPGPPLGHGLLHRHPIDSNAAPQLAGGSAMRVAAVDKGAIAGSKECRDTFQHRHKAKLVVNHGVNVLRIAVFDILRTRAPAGRGRAVAIGGAADVGDRLAGENADGLPGIQRRVENKDARVGVGVRVLGKVAAPGECQMQLVSAQSLV